MIVCVFVDTFKKRIANHNKYEETSQAGGGEEGVRLQHVQEAHRFGERMILPHVRPLLLHIGVHILLRCHAQFIQQNNLLERERERHRKREANQWSSLSLGTALEHLVRRGEEKLVRIGRLLVRQIVQAVAVVAFFFVVYVVIIIVDVDIFRLIVGNRSVSMRTRLGWRAKCDVALLWRPCLFKYEQKIVL